MTDSLPSPAASCRFLARYQKQESGAKHAVSMFRLAKPCSEKCFCISHLAGVVLAEVMSSPCCRQTDAWLVTYFASIQGAHAL